jgi:hypothetical protein
MDFGQGLVDRRGGAGLQGINLLATDAGLSVDECVRKGLAAEGAEAPLLLYGVATTATGEDWAMAWVVEGSHRYGGVVQ